MSVINLGGERNPLEDLPGYWQKVATIVMHKLAGREPVEISSQDFSTINTLYRGGACLCTAMVGDKLVLQLADAVDAERIIAGVEPTQVPQ